MKPTDSLHPEIDDAPNDTVNVANPKPHPEDSRLDLIAEAHTRVLDGIEGYEAIADKAEPDFRPTALQFLQMHRAHAAELADYLRASGRDPSEDGSFFGTVNKALVSIRAWFEDVDAAMLDRIIKGERHIVEGYEEAREAGQTIEANALLTRHITEIDALMATVTRNP